MNLHDLFITFELEGQQTHLTAMVCCAFYATLFLQLSYSPFAHTLSFLNFATKSVVIALSKPALLHA